MHEWLLRHVYLESLNNYKASKSRATFITFLLSAVVRIRRLVVGVAPRLLADPVLSLQLHETVFAVVFRMVRPYLFLLQMAQLPLIYIGRRLKGKYVYPNCPSP